MPMVVLVPMLVPMPMPGIPDLSKDHGTDLGIVLAGQWRAFIIIIVIIVFVKSVDSCRSLRRSDSHR